MTTSPQRPPYDALVVTLIELRATLYDLERKNSPRVEQYRRLGREADDLIDRALLDPDDDQGAAAASFDGKRMRYTTPSRRGRTCERRAQPEQLEIGLSLSENRTR